MLYLGHPRKGGFWAQRKSYLKSYSLAEAYMSSYLKSYSLAEAYMKSYFKSHLHFETYFKTYLKSHLHFADLLLESLLSHFWVTFDSLLTLFWLFVKSKTYRVATTCKSKKTKTYLVALTCGQNTVGGVNSCTWVLPDTIPDPIPHHDALTPRVPIRILRRRVLM